MGWKDQLRKASFRGISFFVDASSSDFGRRNILHEYPLRDTPYSEDLGRKARQFTIEAYVLGDDYLGKRDALITACERSGQGELIHPSYGQKFVTVAACRVEERTSEGRLARFSMTFAEAGERVFPAARKDVFSRLISAKDNLLSKAQAGFEKSYQTLGFPQFVLGTVKNTVRAFANTLLSIKGSLEGGFAEFYYAARQIVDDIDNLTPDAAKLAPVIMSSISKVDHISDDPKEVIQAYTALMNTKLEIPVTPAAVTVLGETSSRIQERKNVGAFVNLVKRVALAQAAPVVAENVYPTLQDALSARNKILRVIDQQMEVIDLDDDTYQALHDLQKTFSEALPAPDKDLPSIVHYENSQTKPSLVLAYDLYENLNLETDILQRNHVEHPGFVPGGIALEVIRDV